MEAKLLTALAESEEVRSSENAAAGASTAAMATARAVGRAPSEGGASEGTE